jgi:hypothetical protein
MTVTPFEVRVEWLIRVRDLDVTGVESRSGQVVLPVTAQAGFKSAMIDRSKDGTRLTVDGSRLDPASVSADFVTVGNYGVTTRTSPVPEPVDEAAVGVTLAYPVAQAPSEVEAELVTYPTNVASVPIAVTDPWGATPRTLTADSRVVRWQKRMAGFRRPVIQPVDIAPSTWPLASILLLLVAGIGLWLGWKRGLTRSGNLASVCCAAAIVLYPFIRPPVPDLLDRSAPSQAETKTALTQLLTNIYRAFDYRTEDAVYDRLAVSATGDQLSEIYLEHVHAMELENRGGARASVDEVDIEEVNSVRRDGDGFVADAEWTVSGSVSHFGHVHYRTNRYHADVRIVPADDSWKIDGIEVKQEERIL